MTMARLRRWITAGLIGGSSLDDRISAVVALGTSVTSILFLKKQNLFMFVWSIFFSLKIKNLKNKKNAGVAAWLLNFKMFTFINSIVYICFGDGDMGSSKRNFWDSERFLRAQIPLEVMVTAPFTDVVKWLAGMQEETTMVVSVEGSVVQTVEVQVVANKLENSPFWRNFESTLLRPRLWG